MLMNGMSEGMIIMQHTTVLWNESTCGSTCDFRVTKKSGAVVTSWCQQQKKQSVSALLYWLTVVLSTKFPSSSLRWVVSCLTGKIQIWPGSSLQTLLQPLTETFTLACIFCLTNWRIKRLYCSQSDSCELHPPLNRKLRSINQLHPVFIFFPSLVERVGGRGGSLRQNVALQTVLTGKQGWN